ncbi:Rhs family protein [Labilithrix luteola]|uniref:Rhs family protein n=1 Tax=Labilithrix luteola TaxID=1391654 RepID=A0A0K1Q5U1_9BACT|nr:Rhs family protein [Labilithrix luteola]
MPEGGEAKPAPSIVARPQLDGRGFPDKVLALTWDDGPDAHTLELASYLKSHRISATFFVVREWIDGISDDPGDGRRVLETGYRYLPILGDLVELGHRLGNHTAHHAVLREAIGVGAIERELLENQREIDPFLGNELRLFRVPGGGWGSAAMGVVGHDVYLSSLVGPMFWDIDRKDWDHSLECDEPRGSRDCERSAPGGAWRTKPSVIAARYLGSIERTGHGIVLLHDRVGHVGSTYALDIAHALIPQLEARGFVFAAPILHFSPPSTRLVSTPDSPTWRWADDTLRVGDVNGDGRDDICGRSSSGIQCVIATSIADDGLPRTIFRETKTPMHDGPPSGMLHLADVTGDGQSDVCVRAARAIACAAADVTGTLGAYRVWEAEGDSQTLGFADVDGDGKADACDRTATGIVCARSTGKKFDRPHVWLADAHLGADLGDTLALADVDGDGKADVCGSSVRGITCALSDGHRFGRAHRWSTEGGLAKGLAQVRYGDLNGDGRADVCTDSGRAIRCAFSNGRGFLQSSSWLDENALAAQGWTTPELAATLQLGDINGDGRADLCGRGPDGLSCALAP